jgi:hypothetical protein
MPEREMADRATDIRGEPGMKLPNVAELLGGLLRRVPEPERPLLIAIAERLAAERYRGWAKEAGSPDREAGLLACAEREDAIARRVESLHPDASATQRRILDSNPDLSGLNTAVFAGRPFEEQFAIQAQGERAGAALWRMLAQAAETEEARDAYLACARLEEESASYLESLIASVR